MTITEKRFLSDIDFERHSRLQQILLVLFVCSRVGDLVYAKRRTRGWLKSGNGGAATGAVYDD